jgi:hypothetical protein
MSFQILWPMVVLAQQLLGCRFPSSVEHAEHIQCPLALLSILLSRRERYQSKNVSHSTSAIVPEETAYLLKSQASVALSFNSSECFMVFRSHGHLERFSVQ